MLHWTLTSPRRKQIYTDVIAGLRENRMWFARYQTYLREYQPPAFIVWGPNDGYMPKGAALAYLRDLRCGAARHGGRGTLAAGAPLDEVTELIGDFFDRFAGPE